ncbi:MAG: hypothetical protein M3453_17430, partial [Pseudomonadota bacterium]|nr:hypothetical protein [Pseudomonadota bacterium]
RGTQKRGGANGQAQISTVYGPSLSLTETGYGRLHPLHILQQLGIVGVDDDPLDAERSTLAAG